MPNLLDYRWYTDGRMIFAELSVDATLSESFVGIVGDADLAYSITAEHNHKIEVRADGEN